MREFCTPVVALFSWECATKFAALLFLQKGLAQSVTQSSKANKYSLAQMAVEEAVQNDPTPLLGAAFLGAAGACQTRQFWLPAIEVSSFSGASCCPSSWPMPSLCKVTDSLFLSNSRSACAENLLVQEGVTFCINVSRQQPFPSSQRLQTLRVPVFDDPAEDLYKYFEPCSEAIESTIQSGGKCLVYCKNGRSRSAAICTAYLMKHHKLSLKDAFEVRLWARGNKSDGLARLLSGHPQWGQRACLRVDILAALDRKGLCLRVVCACVLTDWKRQLELRNPKVTFLGISPSE